MSDVCVCMRDLVSEFNSVIEGSLAFCALMLFLCSILCFMCSGISLHVECIVLLACFVDNDVCEEGVCNVYIWQWLNVRESSLRVYSELCPVCFSIVRECVSVLL